MENSNAFEGANAAVAVAHEGSAGEDFPADGGDFEEGGYIESKAPDMDDGNDGDDPASDGEEKPLFSDRIMKYLDGITEKEEDGKKPEDAPADFARVPATPEEEMAAIISSVPSERGRERIRGIISAKNEAEGRYRKNQGVINGIRNFVEESGIGAAELAQNIEYSRLVGQGDEQSLRIALEMLEDQREMICKRLDEERPGVDLLSDFPDLKAAVLRREISPQHAARLARYERKERDSRREEEERASHDRDHAGFVSDLEQTRHAITSYLRSRSGEADHAFKVTRLKEHLSRPGVLEELTQNLDSKRWFAQIRFMYDNIVVPPARPPQRMQPIRSRPVMAGRAGSRPGATMMEKMGDILDSMGI